MSNGKYGALQTISVIFKVLAVIAAVLTIIVAVFTLIGRGGYGAGGFMATIIVLIYGAIVCLYFLALSESIIVFLDIEENTRLTAENTRQTNDLLRKFLNRQP